MIASVQIFVPRSDTVTRLKLTKTDFENHIVMTTENSEECSFLSVNGKVSYCIVAGGYS